MNLKDRYAYCIEWFQRHMPAPQTELEAEDPFQLVVAVVLSAQCTDKRVNMITPALFAAYPTPEAMAKATFEDINGYIKSVSFANNKTRHLMGLSKMLVEEFGEEVPQTVEGLVRLPGVGRKSANVVMSVAWSQPNMAVDTHVFRVAARIGLTRGAKNPAQAESQLVQHLPESLIHKAHHWLILHGRYVCLARRPLCEQCGLRDACRFYKQEMRHVISGERPLNREKDAVNKVDGIAKLRRKKPGSI